MGRWIRSLAQASWFRATLACTAIAVSVAWVWRWRIVEHATRPNYLTTADLFVYFFPMLQVGYDHLRAGELFFWNANQMSGMPGLATLQAGFLYPFHLLYLLVPTATGMAVMAVFHTLFAGGGMLLLARTRGLGWLPCVAAAGYYALTTVLPWFYWPPGMEAAAWLPLGVAAIDGLESRRDRRWLPVLAAAVLMPLLAGGYQTTVATYYAYALWVCGNLLQRWWSRRETLGLLVKRLAPVASAGIAGILLTAPQLLTTLELSGFAGRSTMALGHERMWMHGIPSPWGSFDRLWEGLVVSPPEFIAIATFVGVTAILLAILGVLRLSTSSLVLCAFCAFGGLSLWAPDWFLDFRATLPVLGWFRMPAREFFLAKFAVALLLAHGAGLLLDGRRDFRPAVVLSVGTALLMAAVLFWAVHTRGQPMALALGSVGVILSALIVSGVVHRGIAVTCLLGLLAYDSLEKPFNGWALPYVDDQWRGIYEAERSYQVLSTLGGYDRSLVLGSVREVKGAMLAGTFSPIDYDPLALASLHLCLQLSKAAGPAVPGPEPFFAGTPADLVQSLKLPGRRCLDLSSVALAVVPQMTLADAGVSAAWHRTGEPISVPDSLHGHPKFLPTLVRNPNALRRTYGVYSWECRPSPEAEMGRAIDPFFDYRATVVLEEGAGCGVAPAPDKSLPKARVKIVRHHDTEVEIRAEFAAPGFVVLTDSFYPGWEAFVDGGAVRIWRANGMYRAVRVPAGESTVVFRYQPYSFYLGCALLLPAFLLLLVTWRRMGFVGSSGGFSPDDDNALAQSESE